MPQDDPETIPVGRGNVPDILSQPLTWSRFWKWAVGGLLSFVGAGVFYFGFGYIGDVITAPWAHGIFNERPQGDWLGEATLGKSRVYQLKLKLTYEIPRGKQQRSIARGTVQACTPGFARKAASIYSRPSWTGSTMNFFTELKFDDQSSPRVLACHPGKGTLDCVLDFKKPMTKLERAFLEDYGEKQYRAVYGPIGFQGQAPIVFTRLDADAAALVDVCAR
jgi:hypothetical protein